MAHAAAQPPSKADSSSSNNSSGSSNSSSTSSKRNNDYDLHIMPGSVRQQTASTLRRNVSWEERMGVEGGATSEARLEGEDEVLSWREFAGLSAKMLLSNPGGTHADGVPHLKLDLTMAMSCMALFPMALVYLHIGQVSIFNMLSFLTVTSCLSDAVFHNNTFFDLLDRYTATLSVIAITGYAFCWMWLQSPSYTWAIAAPVQLGLLLTPLTYLQASRSCLIGSVSWQSAHCKWHYAAAACCSLTALISRYVVMGDAEVL